LSLKIGLLGAGGHSRFCHGPALKLFCKNNPNQIELSAICDLDSEKADKYAEEFGFSRAYTDLDKMLDKESLDGILAITPISITEKIAGYLLKKNIPVLIEKPPGVDLDAAKRLLSLAEKCGTPHMISFNRQFVPAIQKACDWINAGGIERQPKIVIARMLRAVRREDNFVAATGIHAASVVLCLLDKPKVITTVKTLVPESGCFLFNSQIEFENGSSASLIISPDVGNVEETYEIHGYDYCISININSLDHKSNCSLKIKHISETVLAWQAPSDYENSELDGTYGETEAFVKSLQGKRAWNPSLKDGLNIYEVAQAIQNSHEYTFENK